jgi:hypothetical protein
LIGMIKYTIKEQINKVYMVLCRIVGPGLTDVCKVKSPNVVEAWLLWAWGSVVVKALHYKSEGPGIDSRCCQVFFPWHLTVPCALGSTQPLKMSTRLILGVKAAGA